jgi:hypothetical protein
LGAILSFWPLNSGLVSDFGFGVSNFKPAQTGGTGKMRPQ